MSLLWKNNKERSLVFILKFIRWFALTFGRKLTMVLLYPICFYYYLFSPQAKRNIKKFLTKVLARRVGFKDIYKQYYTFATVLLDRVYSLTNKKNYFEVTVHGAENLEKVENESAGMILLGSHLGSFELMHVLAVENDLSLKIMMHLEDSQQVIKLLHELNPKIEDTIITMGSPSSILETHEWLMSNGSIGILADRVYHEDKTIVADFLGSPAHFALGPFKLAKLTGAQCLFFCAVCDDENNYQIYFEKLSFSQSDTPENMLLKYIEKLAYYAEKYPHNWFNFYDYWDLG